jgi:hypothetical protein
MSNATFDFGSFELESSIPNENQFSCQFSSFGNISSILKTANYHLNLYFESEFGNIEITPNPATISAVIQFGSLLSPSNGDSLGDYTIKQIFPSFVEPTNYKSYNLTLGFYFNGLYESLRLCEQSNIFSVECTIPNSFNLFSNVKQPTRFQMDLRINNIYALKLVPYFTVFPYVNVTQIFPSRHISTDSEVSIQLKTSEFNFMGYKIFMKIEKGKEKGISECVYNSPTNLTCRISSIPQVGNYSMFISVNGKDKYQSLTSTLEFFDNSIIVINSTSTKTLKFAQETEIYVVGENFIQTNDIQVVVFDNYISRVSRGIYINSTHVKTFVKPFHDLNLLYPMTFKLRISFNAGLNYQDASISLRVEKFKNILISPTLISKDVLSEGIMLKGLESGIDHDPMIEKLEYRLYSNSTFYVKMNCLNFTKCNLISPPNLGVYTLKIGLINLISSLWKDIYIFSDNTISVYDFSSIPILSIEPNTTVIQNSTTPITVNGDFRKFKTVMFRIRYSEFLFAVKELSLNGQIIDGNKATLNLPMINTNAATIELSLNGGVNFHFVKDYETILRNFFLLKY